MITETYICDLCKQSVGKKELLNLVVELRIPTKTYGNQLCRANKDICRKCLKATDILTEEEEEIIPEVKESNEKVLERKFIELLEQLGVSFTDHEHDH